MMASPIVWLNSWTFRVRHPVSGRSTDVMIPGAEKLEPQKLAYLVAWQTEETLAELAGPETRISGPKSKAFQHDLGKTLKAIRQTKRLVKETGHGRYY